MLGIQGIPVGPGGCPVPCMPFNLAPPQGPAPWASVPSAKNSSPSDTARPWCPAAQGCTVHCLSPFCWSPQLLTRKGVISKHSSCACPPGAVCPVGCGRELRFQSPVSQPRPELSLSQCCGQGEAGSSQSLGWEGLSQVRWAHLGPEVLPPSLGEGGVTVPWWPCAVLLTRPVCADLPGQGEPGPRHQDQEPGWLSVQGALGAGGVVALWATC